MRLWVACLALLPSLQADELRREDDPRTSPAPRIYSKASLEQARPKDSVFWKVDSDGNEWRKDSYGTIWKKNTGLDPFDPASWDIDGFDRRQAHRIGMDTLMQFKLNLDGTIQPESVKKTTWIAHVDPEPTTLPIYMQQAEWTGPATPWDPPVDTNQPTPTLTQKTRPKLIPASALQAK